MHSSRRWRTRTLHHLSDEMARSLPPDIGFDWPAEEVRRIVSEQVVLVLPYRDFSGAEHLGQLVVHQEIAEVMAKVFEALFAARFPIGSMVPVAAFAWNDNRSMVANNCVGFHFRSKTGKEDLSWHAYGRAIDINPRVNPYQKDGLVLPAGAVYAPDHPGACTPDSLPVRLLRARGFTWGGDWTSLRDYMHFELPSSS